MFARMMTLVPALLVILAAAEQESVAIVDVDSPETMLGLSVQTTKTLVESAAALKMKAITPEAVRAKLEDKAYAALVKCAGQAACVSQYVTAKTLGAKRLVLGSLTRNEKNYLLKLWLIDLDTLEVVADVDRQVLIAARRLQRDVEQAAPPLLRGEKEAHGTLRITTNVKNAELSVNGDFVGSPPYEVQLKPGKYEVKLEKTKYLSVTRLLNVEANQKNETELKLLLIPGAAPDDEPVANAKKDAAGSGGPGFHPSVTTWVAAGLAVASLGVGIGFGISASNGDKAITNTLDPATGAYGVTRKDALGVQQSALIANVAYGVAGTAAIATIVFAIIDVKNSPVQVAPLVNGAGAGLAAGGRF